MWSHVRSVVRPTVPPLKLFAKHVAATICRKFGRKFTTLSYADRKSENLTDNQQLCHLYTRDLRIVFFSFESNLESNRPYIPRKQ